MKYIQPIDVWVDGITKQANKLTLLVTYDNLDTEAVINYVLSDDNNQSLVTGSVRIEGVDYQNWGTSTDSNSDAYIFVANQLNLTLI